jgi:putative solute:sodium symporter small subunit
MFEADERVDWSAIRNPLFVLLGFWLTFFLIVHASLRALNKLMIPVIGVPLGYYVAAQGSAAVLVAFLYLLTSKQRRSRP